MKQERKLGKKQCEREKGGLRVSARGRDKEQARDGEKAQGTTMR